MGSTEDMVMFIRQVFSSALEISDEWVKSSIDTDFTDFASLAASSKPTLFDDEDVEEKFETLADRCKEYLSSCDSAELWKRLLEEDFSPKNMPILLWFAMEAGLEANSSISTLRSANYAASAYLLFTSIKGAQGYEIFHTGLYNKSMDVFRKIVNELLANVAERDAGKKKKRTKGPSLAATTFNKTHNRTHNKTSRGHRSRNDEEDCVEEASVKYDTEDLRSLLLVSTNSLFVALKRLCLLSYTEESQRTVDFIRDVSRIDIDRNTRVSVVSNSTAFAKLVAFSDRAFALLQRYLDNGHSEGGILAYSHFILPRLLHLTADNALVPSTSTIPMAMSITKDIVVLMIKERIDRGAVEEDEFYSIQMILANIVDKCADRADYRSKVSTAFVQVFALLPNNIQFEVVQVLRHLSLTDKSSCRSFIVETIPQLLNVPELHQFFDLKQKGEDEQKENEAVQIKEEPDSETSASPNASHLDASSSTKRREQEAEGDDDPEEEMQIDEAEDEEDEGSDGEGRKKKKERQRKEKKKQTVSMKKIQPGEFVYRTQLQCLVDKVASVRAKALLQLETLLAKPTCRDNLIKMAQIMMSENKEMFLGVEKEHKEKRRTKSRQGDTATLDPDADETVVPEEIVKNKASQSGIEEKTEITNLIFYLLCEAAEDEKIPVRKYALLPIRAYFRVTDDDREIKKLLKELKNRSMDSALSVRKQAAEVINDILDDQPYFREQIVKTWLKTIMPMVCDRENGAKELAVKIIFERIFLPFQNNEMLHSTWSLLNALQEQEGYRRYLVRVLDEQSKLDRVTDGMVKGVERQLLQAEEDGERERIDSLWMLMADLCLVYNKMSPQIALNAWSILDYSDEALTARAVHIVRVLSHTANHQKNGLNIEQRAELSRQLIDMLINFKLGIPLIKPVYVLIATLLDAVTDSGTGKAKLQQFGKDLLIACRKKLNDAINFTLTLDEKNVEGKLDDVCLIRVLDSIAEALQFSPALYAGCSKLLEGLQQIMSSGYLVADYHNQVLNAHILDDEMTSQPISARPSAASQHNNRETVGSALPSSRAVGSQVGVGSQRNPKEGYYWSDKLNLEIPTAIGKTEKLLTQPVRSYCAVAIGKVCILDPKFAKVMVPVFVRQLQSNPDHLIRSNIVIVLGDLCVRFTSLVGRYSAIIAGCLKDRSALVKMQTLQTLTFLIKEQYLIFKGEIMYQLVSMTLDADKQIRKYASFCLTNVLMPQFPSMFRNHFIECLVYFNQIPKGFIPGSELNEDDVIVDKSAFNLSGKRQRENRVHLYRFMIQTFTDTNRFEIMAHLCDQVLAKLRTQINLGKMRVDDPKVTELLADIFIILSMEEIRLKMDLGKNPNASPEDEEMEIIPEKVEKVAKKALTQAFMRATLENVMPPLFDIKRMLFKCRSPLIRLCIYAIKKIVEQFSDELDEFFAGNEDLREEYAFDLHRYKEMSKVEKAAQERLQLERQRKEEERRNRERSRRSRQVQSADVQAPHTVAQVMMEAMSGKNTNMPEAETEHHTSQRTERAETQPHAEDEDVQMREEEEGGEEPAPTQTSQRGASEEKEQEKRNTHEENDRVDMTQGTSEETVVQQSQTEKKTPQPQDEGSQEKTNEEEPMEQDTDVPAHKRDDGAEQADVGGKEKTTEKENEKSATDANSQEQNAERPGASVNGEMQGRKGEEDIETKSSPNFDSSSDGIEQRAISTPIRNMFDNNITFAGLDLSAIQNDDGSGEKQRTSRRSTAARLPLKDRLADS